MNVALFGGTFDPVHMGHLAVARAAQEHFRLARVYFVPAEIPPHKTGHPVTAFEHRYAMLALATQGEKSFVPSLLEAPAAHIGESRARAVQARVNPKEGLSGAIANYTIDTVRDFKQTMRRGDRLFFLIGIDAFLEIATWREPEALLRECEFIVVSRPGFSLGDIGKALPEGLRPSEAVTRALGTQAAAGDVVLPGATLHLLPGVAAKASATEIRRAAHTGRRLARLVGPQVAEYIRKQGLYQDKNGSRQQASDRRLAKQ